MPRVCRTVLKYSSTVLSGKKSRIDARAQFLGPNHCHLPYGTRRFLNSGERAFFTLCCWLGCLSLTLIRMSFIRRLPDNTVPLWKWRVRLVSQVSGPLIGSGFPHKASKLPSSPLFLISKNHINPTLLQKITQELIFYTLQNSENQICLTISATISTVLILLIILCRITLRWPTRGPKFWPGYLHLSPRDGTRTSEPAGSMKWETGSYKPRHIGIGLVVSAGLNLVVQLCSATEVRESARPTLGKKNHT